MEEYRARLQKGDGQNVRTFVSDHWTLEYDLAFSGLGEEVHLAVSLAHRDEAISAGTVNRTQVEGEAKEYFGLLVTQAGGDRELLSTRIYGPLHAGGISKGVTAQYLAELLTSRYSRDGASLRQRLPPYLMAAIDYVTRSDRGENPGG